MFAIKESKLRQIVRTEYMKMMIESFKRDQNISKEDLVYKINSLSVDIDDIHDELQDGPLALSDPSYRKELEQEVEKKSKNLDLLYKKMIDLYGYDAIKRFGLPPGMTIEDIKNYYSKDLDEQD